jgi:hypothetical protein
MAKPIQQAVDIIRKAKADVNKLLSEPEHIQNLLEINTNFTRIESRLTFMGGILETDKKTESKSLFPPITNFMGENIATAKPLTKDDLTPDEDRKQKFLAKAKKLWDEIGNYSPQNILTNYRIEEDIIILRWVAKKAGVKEYETAELTTQFVEEIQLAVEMKKEEGELQKGIDDATRTKDLKPLTEEDIKGDLSLQNLGAKPGDSFIIEKGKKKIIPAAITA